MESEFIEYVWSFYGPEMIYGHFFNHALTKHELVACVEILKLKVNDLSYDTFDREFVRDILLTLRGDKNTEYKLL
jgi:hypothetical protein